MGGRLIRRHGGITESEAWGIAGQIERDEIDFGEWIPRDQWPPAPLDMITPAPAPAPVPVPAAKRTTRIRRARSASGPSPTRYLARAVRSGTWWAVEVLGVAEGRIHAQARRRDQVPVAAAAAITAWFADEDGRVVAADDIIVSAGGRRIRRARRPSDSA